MRRWTALILVILVAGGWLFREQLAELLREHAPQLSQLAAQLGAEPQSAHEQTAGAVRESTSVPAAEPPNSSTAIPERESDGDGSFETPRLHRAPPLPIPATVDAAAEDDAPDVADAAAQPGPPGADAESPIVSAAPNEASAAPDESLVDVDVGTHSSAPQENAPATTSAIDGGVAASSSVVRPQLPQWRAAGKSVEGRPLEVAQWGSGALRVLVVAGLHGDRPDTVAAAEALAAALGRHGGVGHDAAVTIVRNANPDGAARRWRTNARGVDVDRNFGGHNWRKIDGGGRWLSGRRPDSEPETQMLAGLISSKRPHRLVIILGDGQQGWVRSVSASAELDTLLTRHSQLPKVNHNGPLPSGSLASYAADDRAVETLIVNLPNAEESRLNWPQVESLLLAVCGMPVDNTHQALDITAGTAAQTAPNASPHRVKPRRPLVDVVFPARSDETDRSQSHATPDADHGAWHEPRIIRLPPADQIADADAMESNSPPRPFHSRPRWPTPIPEPVSFPRR